MSDSDSASGVDAWKQHTSAFDRVRSVAVTVTKPRPAAWIADEAAVSENTARSHLRRLVEMNVLVEDERRGTARYAPDPLYTRMQTLRELLDEHDRAGLIELKEQLQRQIEAWREEWSVESHDELRGLAAETATADETRTVRQTAREWELVDYRLAIVEDAIDNYGAYGESETASA